MPLRKNNTRVFHRRLYAGELQKITLLKRDDNQRQGTVTSHTVFQCRISPLMTTGETLQGSMNVGSSATWYIPVIELNRVGVHYLNPADRIQDKQGRVWAPLATTVITTNVFENHLTVQCERLS